jgi:hypothetical protein
MMNSTRLAQQFAAALHFPEYLATAKPHERDGWDRAVAANAITSEQRALIAGFSRRINVLVISGTWCGDCVQQVPILHRIAEGNPAKLKDASDRQSPGIDLRLIDRDANIEFAQHFQICGGNRVPAAIFMNEDFEFVSILGDKTLTRLRRLAASQLGAACPLPGADVPSDERASVTAEWVNEFERVSLLLRLSAKLRQRHGD